MGMTPAQVAQHLGPDEYVKLCTKVAQMWDQRFDVLEVRKGGSYKRPLVTLVLENGTKKRVEI